MMVFCSIVMLLYPCIGVINVRFSGVSRRGEVRREGGSVEIVLHGVKIKRVCLPWSGAVRSDCDIVGDCLWLDERGEGDVWIWKEKSRAGGVLYAKMAPMVIDWDDELAAANACLREM